MDNYRLPSFLYIDTILISVITFFLGHIGNQILLKYNILTLKQIEKAFYIYVISASALAIRVNKHLLVFCLTVGLYKFAGKFANNMKDNFYNILYLECKEKSNFNSMQELMSHKSSQYWIRISKFNELVKEPMFNFILLYSLTKH